MKRLAKNVWKGIHSRVGAYVAYALSALALALIRSAAWAYGWIAELYPLHDKFIPTLKGIIIFCIVFNTLYLFSHLMRNKAKQRPIKRNLALDIFQTVVAVLSFAAFLYTLVLALGFDKGVTRDGILNGINNMRPDFPVLGLALVVPVAGLFAETAKSSIKAIIASLVAASIIFVPAQLAPNSSASWEGTVLPEFQFTSENVLTNESAYIAGEMLSEQEKPDAQNILEADDNCWTPQSPNRKPAEGFPDINNSFVEIKFNEAQTFNTAVIEEVGNQVQYFRLQALINEEWVTVYQSEKIQALRICSFDAVTTDSIRLSIDKFRSVDVPAHIKSLKLYNEAPRTAENFEVTAYQRLDGDVPTEILAKGEEYVNNYARYYDVYSTVILFRTVVWDENGKITFGDLTEEQFAAEVNALKEIINHRSNKNHEVKLIVTALSDGLWGDIPGGVNGYMAQHWESIADQIAEFVDKYDFAGVDIDWEYPANAEDWEIYNKFIARLDDNMNKDEEGRILTAALSAWGLGMSKDTLDRLDQIQFMAYDGNDEDGYQSSLQQAEAGLEDFINNGADISKINIGIAAYGRPINNSPYWATWRDLEQANYWDNKYYNVPDAGQIYDGTFCSPALAGDKTALALLTGCGGVMVFRVACDKTMDDPNSVACGIENALNRYVQNW